MSNKVTVNVVIRDDSALNTLDAKGDSDVPTSKKEPLDGSTSKQTSVNILPEVQDQGSNEQPVSHHSAASNESDLDRCHRQSSDHHAPADKILIGCCSQIVAEQLLTMQRHVHLDYYKPPTSSGGSAPWLPFQPGKLNLQSSCVYLEDCDESYESNIEDRDAISVLNEKDRSSGSLGTNTVHTLSHSILSIYERRNPEPPIGKNSSIVTVFSMWSTMMGTSILTMPWALQQAGFVLGILLIALMAFIMCYLGYRILRSSDELAKATHHPFPFLLDFSKACRHYMGKPGQMLCFVASIISLLGALIVYYVLLVNFAYNTGTFIRDFIFGKSAGNNSISSNSNQNLVVLCKKSPHLSQTASISDEALIPSNFTTPLDPSDELFAHLWNPTRAVPAWLLIVIFPLISVRSPTFFTKFTALGTISIFCIFVLTFAKAGMWGIHMEFSSTNPFERIPLASSRFPALTGICTLAFFIHNGVESIMRCNKNKANNARDTITAFILVALTYLVVGVVFYISFPLPKSCLEDNFLNNLPSTDVFAFVGRLALFFQILTVFPLVMYILRVQVMHTLFHAVYPGFFKVTIFHILMIVVCLLFAMFLPSIGTVIRFCGSLSALIYIFALPCLVFILSLVRKPIFKDPLLHDGVPSVNLHPQKVPPHFQFRSLSSPRIFFLLAIHFFIIFLGVANFGAQFALSLVGPPEFENVSWEAPDYPTAQAFVSSTTSTLIMLNAGENNSNGSLNTQNILSMASSFTAGGVIGLSGIMNSTTLGATTVAAVTSNFTIMNASGA